VVVESGELRTTKPAAPPLKLSPSIEYLPNSESSPHCAQADQPFYHIRRQNAL
jgi:hypothetical protein